MSATDTLLAYSLAALLLTLTPGLDTALILRTAAAEGGKKAFQAGLGALLAASATAYDIVKWCGALYLLWLGIQLILHPRQSFSTTEGDVSAPQSNWFIRGVGQPLIARTFLLVTIHVVIGTLWSLTLIMMTGYASRLLKSRRFIRWMERLTGGLFMFFAVKLALSHR